MRLGCVAGALRPGERWQLATVNVHTHTYRAGVQAYRFQQTVDAQTASFMLTAKRASFAQMPRYT
jgi:hypothetical protein